MFLLQRARFLWLVSFCSASRHGRTMAGNGGTAHDLSVAFVTCPSEEVGKKIARGLVEKKLAACVNIIPNLTSIYVWQGKIEEDAEVLLKIKTRTSVMPELTAFVRDNHPNEVAEVVGLKIDQGNESYLKWVAETVPELKK
eukprot:Seg1960.5 transcript_id=Seg1960.5/GoldUCD/mRNA.D3Y31 product="Protein CutA-like" protein_id=Seg1960.5/GoldUCD/D3Y31